MALSFPCAVVLLCLSMLSLRATVRLIVLLASTTYVFSIPLDSSDDNQPTSVVYITNVVTSEFNVVETATVMASPMPITDMSSGLTSSSMTDQTTSSSMNSSPFPVALTSPPLLFPTPAIITEMLTVTATVTESASTVIVSEPTETVTETITSPPSLTMPDSYFQSTWSAPTQITDLGPFNISSFAYGQTNLQIVDGIPATASVTSRTVVAAESTPTITSASSTWDNSSSVIQLLYPANSINPGTEPQGGADFYATPIDLHNASSIVMEYSVFFPADFDWVLAGKLPGIFGGHKGCSGGDDAQTCFSTRLMWRESGAGELYLYAPKDKQTQNLCSTPPLSVCNADYGLSIGRGSFSFTPGAWTHLKQTISLNTPGQQDGGFQLEVNGQQILQLFDVFYRDSQTAPSRPTTSPDLDQAPEAPEPEAQPIADPQSLPTLAPTPTQPSNGLNGLLGGLLGGLGGLLFRVTNSPARQFFMLRDEMNDAYLASSTPPSHDGWLTSDPEGEPTTTLTTTYTQTSTTVTTVYEPYPPTNYPLTFDLSHSSEPAGFIGMFFSTFFGGHDSRYATPRDQYAWFKDFAMSISPAPSEPQPPSFPSQSAPSSATSVPTTPIPEAQSLTASPTIESQSSIATSPVVANTSESA